MLFRSGRIDWSFGANYNKTEVTEIAPTPAQLAPQSFFDLGAEDRKTLDKAPEVKF